jgi:hypothetical protein
MNHKNFTPKKQPGQVSRKAPTFILCGVVADPVFFHYATTPHQTEDLFLLRTD